MRVTPEWYEKHKAGSAIRKDAVVVPSFDKKRPAPIYALVGICRLASLPEPIAEYTFHPKRKWRFDYCWPQEMVALEVDGGIWTDGRHSRGSGRIKDMEKMSEAAILGYRVLYATPQEVSNGIALDRVSRALGEFKTAA